VSGGHAWLSRPGAHPTVTVRIGKTIEPYGCGYVKSQQLESATDISGFIFCFDARAGASITSGYTGSTGRKGLTYVGNALVVMSHEAGGWIGGKLNFLTHVGAWILYPKVSLTGVGSGR
jgi:hypothetical protein